MLYNEYYITYKLKISSDRHQSRQLLRYYRHFVVFTGIFQERFLPSMCQLSAVTFPDFIVPRVETHGLVSLVDIFVHANLLLAKLGTCSPYIFTLFIGDDFDFDRVHFYRILPCFHLIV